jgi:hypothetical protein
MLFMVFFRILTEAVQKLEETFAARVDGSQKRMALNLPAANRARLRDSPSRRSAALALSFNCRF